MVKVNRRAAERLGSGHVWVYSSDVTDRGAAAPGDAVVVADQKGRRLGTAFYSSTSEICLRLVSRGEVTVDRDFFHTRLSAAKAFRDRFVSGTEACRVVYSESDGLPGLIVDRYGDCLSVQALCQTIDKRLPEVVSSLADLYSPRAILLRNDAAVRKKESLELEVRVAFGTLPVPLEFEMNGLRWQVDLEHGQKTGQFLDQRENYVAAARYARGRALDCFSSTGGFALHIVPKCESVLAADASQAALDQAAANAALNGISNIDFRKANVFELLTNLAAQDARFDTVILDPPAFAKSRATIDRALAGYKEINLKALRLLVPGGILVSNSCSFHVGESVLLGVIAEAALDTGRTLRVLERRAQSADHPVLLTVPESHYLKCLIFEVT